jgi:glucose/arabinose dehydrogenase/mono/diheme cytochrome c family protein
MHPARQLICVLVAAGAASSAWGAEPLECRWASTPPKIDGRLNDPAWKDAQVIENFTSAWLPEGQRKPPTATKARLLWDREYLYFSAEMEDWDVFANVTEQDGPIWTCDVFELFFKPAVDKPGYYEFEVNAANGKLDMFLPSRGSGGYNRHAKERDFHLESAVNVNGTLNNWADRDKGWTVEGRIPWRDFLPTGGRPAPGEIWMHSLCRYDYSAGLENQSLSTDTPVASDTKADFHRYEDYVPLKFVGPPGQAAVPRAPWDGSRLAGSPEPPPPFRAVPAFPRLQTKQPIMVAVEPGRESLLLLECSGYTPVRKARVSRLADDPNATDPEVLLDLDESIYDVCFHPRFAENGYLYIGANGRAGEGDQNFNDRVLRYTMDRRTGRIDPASRQVIMEWHSFGHNGMSLTFGKDGMFYVTSGDGTSDCDEWNAGQDLTRLLAKLLRIDVDHPAGGRPYSIPADNPFLALQGARPETWAYGFRNPWRMTMDRATGDLWVGENGQDLWEYARIAHRGENYGWPIKEGSHDLQPNRQAGPTPFSAPLIEHAHTDFRSLTGGIVYYGKKFPELSGCYIYGDHSTGQIWAAKQRDGKLLQDRPIARTTLGITGFCETPQGDILVVDYLGNAIAKLEPAPAPSTPAAPFPEKLSETGLFRDTPSLTPQAALIPYEVNVPAWHDGANSKRYIALPNAERMEVMEPAGWNFPDGTALVQTLSLGSLRIETRVLLRQQGLWSGYSYAWNETQSDAVRVPKEGDTRLLSGQRPWRFPGRQECAFCHSRAANFVLGLSTPQLNRPGRNGVNQIAQWERDGWLKFNHAATEQAEWTDEFSRLHLGDVAKQARLDLVLPAAGQRQPRQESPLLPHAVVDLPRLVDPHDQSAALHDRARAYLQANCAHCHVRSGGGNSNMQLGSNLADADMGILDATPLHGAFGIAEARLAAPGEPGRSVLIYRPAIRGANQMPPVGTMVPDSEGVALLSQWIGSLPPRQRPAPAETEHPK